ncbi:MAG: DNA repair protein RecO [Planctomycetaceae bacterium]|jgi:DNA repair protein RecO (recombination protein O)|nr:DNA repair protein RecO [Planctomycetaceae bacterium]
MYQKTEAIVLKTVDFSETSTVLTMFSRDFGKIRALAKGGRRLKGPFESALDLMSHVSISYIPKRGEALDLLTESKLIRRFRLNRENFGGMYAGFYLIELLNEMTVEQEPTPDLFHLAVETLSQFIDAKPIMPALMRFEWRALEITGNFPSLDFCVFCGEKIGNSSPRIEFGHWDGGVICPKCRFGTRQISVITPALRNAICQLVTPNQNAENDETQEAAAIDNSQMGPMRALLNRYVSHLVGKRPAMFNYFSKMK